MKKTKENKVDILNLKRQNHLYTPKLKSFGSIIMDFEKDKKRVFNYKRFFRVRKTTINQGFFEKNKNPLIKEKIQLLNGKLTNKSLTSIQLLNNNFLYNNLKLTQLKFGYLKGYTAYNDKIFKN